MPDLLAGTTVRGLDTPPTVADTEDAQYTTTITTFGTGATAGYADCAVVFVAPTSGRVMLHYNSYLNNSANSTTQVAPEVREGGTVGSGTVVTAAVRANAVYFRSVDAADEVRAGVSLPLSGLTPGATYNARLLHVVGAGTGTIRERSITAVPAT